MPSAKTAAIIRTSPSLISEGEAATAALAAVPIRAPRLVKARTLLEAEDIARIERLAAARGSAPLCVFSTGTDKHVASLGGLVPSNAVVERLADGQVHTLAKVVGG